MKKLNSQELGYIRAELDIIPENQWTTITYENSDGQKDALGHLGRGAGKPHPELTLKLNAACVEKLHVLIQDINDCPSWHPYIVRKFGHLKSPKLRILYALQMLNDILIEEDK